MILKIGWGAGGGVSGIAPGRVTWRMTGSAVDSLGHAMDVVLRLEMILKIGWGSGGGMKKIGLGK